MFICSVCTKVSCSTPISLVKHLLFLHVQDQGITEFVPSGLVRQDQGATPVRCAGLGPLRKKRKLSRANAYSASSKEKRGVCHKQSEEEEAHDEESDEPTDSEASCEEDTPVDLLRLKSKAANNTIASTVHDENHDQAKEASEEQEMSNDEFQGETSACAAAENIHVARKKRSGEEETIELDSDGEGEIIEINDDSSVQDDDDIDIQDNDELQDSNVVQVEKQDNTVQKDIDDNEALDDDIMIDSEGSYDTNTQSKKTQSAIEIQDENDHSRASQELAEDTESDASEDLGDGKYNFDVDFSEFLSSDDNNDSDGDHDDNDMKDGIVRKEKKETSVKDIKPGSQELEAGTNLETTTSSSALQAAQVVGKSQYQCANCPERFSSIKAVQDHVKCQHIRDKALKSSFRYAVPDNQAFPCPTCPRRFTMRYTLDLHILVEHGHKN